MGLDFTEAKENSSGDDDELAVDTRWEDLLPSSAPSGNSDDENSFTERDVAPESLQDQLRWQLNLTRFSDTDRKIAGSFYR